MTVEYSKKLFSTEETGLSLSVYFFFKTFFIESADAAFFMVVGVLEAFGALFFVESVLLGAAAGLAGEIFIGDLLLIEDFDPSLDNPPKNATRSASGKLSTPKILAAEMPALSSTWGIISWRPPDSSRI